MCKLNKEKQEIIKCLVGEELYNNLYWYQKWFIQRYLKDKDIQRFYKIKEFIENGKNNNKSNTGTT